jgi:serine/threonine protein kinase
MAAELHPPSLPLGTVLDDGTRITEFLGQSAGGESYRGEHPRFGSVVAKLLSAEVEAIVPLFANELDQLCGVMHPNLQRFYGTSRVAGRTLLVVEYVEGQTLRSALDVRIARGATFSFRSIFNLLSSVSSALAILHRVGPHGALTSENIFVQPDGRIKVVNVGYARLLFASAHREEMFAQSAYVAPELWEGGSENSRASDLYALGVLTIALASGTHPTHDQMLPLLEEISSRFTPEMRALLETCLAHDPSSRIASAADFSYALGVVFQSLNALPSQGPQSGDSPAFRRNSSVIISAFPEPAGRASAPSVPPTQLPPSGSSHPQHGSSGKHGVLDEPRWVIQKRGRDFGPYPQSEVERQLEAGEIDENTRVFDLYKKESSLLIDVPAFGDFVLDFIPRREKRRLAKGEQRSELGRKAVRTVSVVVVLILLISAGGFAAYLKLRPAPRIIEYGKLVRPTLDQVFEVKKPTYQALAPDSALVAELFQRPDPTVGSVPEGLPSEEPDEDLAAMDLAEAGPPRKLTNDEIQTTLRTNLPRMQRCFGAELRANPNFKGATVNWSVRADGKVFNVRLESAGDSSKTLELCMIRTFRAIRFPAFNDLPMNIAFPFIVQ